MTEKRRVQGIIVLAIVLVVFTGWRLTALFTAGPSGGDERETIRFLACPDCGLIEPVDGTTIADRHDAGQVASTRGGLRFGCSGCNKVTAMLVPVDFSSDQVLCRKCGKSGPDRNSRFLKAIEDGSVRVANGGRVEVRCPSCGEFACDIVPIDK